MDGKVGLTFAAALKSFLRQDRTSSWWAKSATWETAEISVKAAQTGHMVLSTLHTNDAPQTLTRLMNMGVPTFNIASSVLVYRSAWPGACAVQTADLQVPQQALLNAGFSEADLDSSWTLYGFQRLRPLQGSGYKGTGRHLSGHARDRGDQRIIHWQGNSRSTSLPRPEGRHQDLRQSGLLKVKQGVTSLDEVLSTTNV